MKKSSFLHNPKDMLSRSFKPAKCKTTLKLAASRMKLMKNKKEVQVKQMKRELAKLLESGQDQTARIRVEHVIREEKLMAAYELIDIYCELIVARLPIIESQKDCPIDLKEAITSVIFASPRCGDIPELLEARKHFTAKYGKEFVSAAIELRPNCGVSRLLVEKLSAKAPDGQTKIKALTAIAEEHNIKWDPESFGQSDLLPPDDLLNGPNTFEKFSAVHSGAPTNVKPDFQGSPSRHTVDNQPLSFSEQNVRSSQGTHNLASSHNNIGSNKVSSIPHAQMTPAGVGAERGEVNQSFQGEESASFSGQNWNMEFKDATAAAQAAAESAERASMAARAAAELSRHARTPMQSQYSSEVQNSTGDALRDERTAKHLSSKYSSDYLPKDSANSSFSDRQPRYRNKPIDRIEQDIGERLSESPYQDRHHNGKRYGSSRSQASFQDDTLDHSFQARDGNSQQSSSKEKENKVKISMQKQSSKSETEGVNHLQEGFSSEKFDYSGEERIRKQSSFLSSSSHSSISSSDDRYSSSGHQMFNYDDDKDTSVGIDEEHNARHTWQPSYHAAAAPAVFDDTGSDSEDTGFDAGFQLNKESKFHFASPGRNSSSHLSTNTSNEILMYRAGKSPESSISEFSTNKHSFPELSESLEEPKDGSQAGNFGPVTFDDSDGASSEIDIDMLHSGRHGPEDSRDLLTRKNQCLGSSDDEMHKNESQRIETVVESSRKFGFGKTPANQSSFGLEKSQQVSRNAGSESIFYNSVDEVDQLGSSQSKLSLVHEVEDSVGSANLHETPMDDENSDDGKELNFKKLTGGFRQKGYTPRYMRSQLDDTSSSSKRVSKDSPTMTRQSTAYSSVESFTNNGKSKGVGSGKSSRAPNYHSDSDSDSSMEDFNKQPASRRQEPNTQDAGKDVKIQSSSRGSVTYFDSESSDSDDDSATQVFVERSHLGSGFSRRTKPFSSSSTSVSNVKAGSSSRVHVNSDSATERNPPKRYHGDRTPQEPRSRTRNSDQLGNSGQPTSANVASKPSSVSKLSLPVENRKSSGVEQPPSSERKVEKSESTENQKTPSASAISREDSLKKASHVHPKLPDYDTLAAKFQALRMNRQ